MTLIPSKQVRAEMEAEGSRILRYAQQLFRLVQAERENTEDIRTLKAKVVALEQQVHDLQTREAVLLAQAGSVASEAVAKMTVDLALRIGRLEAIKQS